MEKESHLERTVRWMSHDVKICMANDAFVGAMTLMMTHISALAGYFAGREASQPANDHDEFMNFYNAYFSVFPDIQPPAEGRRRKSLIYSHFRNGLIHEHLMKKETAIDQGFAKPSFYIESTSNMIVLNVDHFFADYLRVLGSYSNDIKRKRKPMVQENFIKRAKYLGASEPIV